MQFSLKSNSKPQQTMKVTNSRNIPSVFLEAEAAIDELDSNLACEEIQALGIRQAEQGDFVSALQSFQRCLHLQPQNFKVLEMSAQLFLETDQVLHALQSAEAAVQIQPEWKEGLHTLARCQREIGELLLAKQTYEKLIKMDPQSLEFQDEFGEVNVLVSQLEEKRQLQLQKLKDAQNESEQEVCRCQYHLAHRGHPI